MVPPDFSHWHGVTTFHINVKQGDSAIHVRQYADEDQKRWVDKVVLIDGGVAGYAPEIAETLESLDKWQYKRLGTGPRSRALDTIVVTHWDADHLYGIAKLISLVAGQTTRDWLLAQQGMVDSQALQHAIDQLAIQLPMILYDQTTGRPTTYFVGPDRNWGYWEDGEFEHKFMEGFYEIRHKFEMKWATNTMGTNIDYAVMNLTVTLRAGRPEQTVLQAVMPWAILGPQGAGLIGWDCFEHLSLPHPATSPLHVSKMLSEASRGPAMICVAVQQVHFCDPQNVTNRLNMTWVQKDNYKSILLVPDPDDPVLAGWKRIPFCEHGFVPGPNSAPSTQILKTDTTDENNASVAFMAIWPDSDTARVQQYYGGDLGYAVEENILRWSTIPNEQYPAFREPPQINTIKLSHHGMLHTYDTVMV